MFVIEIYVQSTLYMSIYVCVLGWCAERVQYKQRSRWITTPTLIRSNLAKSVSHNTTVAHLHFHTHLLQRNKRLHWCFFNSLKDAHKSFSHIMQFIVLLKTS